jgi:hypothetical protein
VLRLIGKTGDDAHYLTPARFLARWRLHVDHDEGRLMGLRAYCGDGTLS